jgi:hypothetical protein
VTADRRLSPIGTGLGDEVGRGEIAGGKEPPVASGRRAEQPPPPEPFSFAFDSRNYELHTVKRCLAIHQLRSTSILITIESSVLNLFFEVFLLPRSQPFLLLLLFCLRIIFCIVV